MAKVQLATAFALITSGSSLALHERDLMLAGEADFHERDLMLVGEAANSSVNAATGCNSIDGKKLEYLDRHALACGSGESMTYWKMVRTGCTGINQKFEYFCTSTPGATSYTTRYTGYQEGRDKNLEYLDRHNVACSAGEAMVTWRVEMSGNNLRYKYDCQDIGLGTPTEYTTNCNLMRDMQLQNLDRHTISCSGGAVLTSFRVEDCPDSSGSHQNMRYRYGCAVPPTPAPTPTPTTAPTPTPTSPVLTATGDPHLVSASGAKFDVNQPGEYTLVRVPSDRRMPSMLEMNVTLKPGDNEKCGLWIQRVQFGGSLFDDLVVNVWPEVRSNGAGRPFAFQVEGGVHGLVTGSYVSEQSHAFQAPNATVGRTWTSCPGRQDRKCVEILPFFKTVRDRGLVYEAKAFRLPITSDDPAHSVLATLEVSQRRLSPQSSSRQAIDVMVKDLAGLGFKEIGGLLGTEGHDAHIEQMTSECAAAQKAKGDSRTFSSSGSTMFAS